MLMARVGTILMAAGVSIVALLTTLIVLFALNGDVLLQNPKEMDNVLPLQAQLYSFDSFADRTGWVELI